MSAKRAAKAAPIEDQSTTEGVERNHLAVAIDQFYAQTSNLSLGFIPISLDLIILHKLPDAALYVPAAADELGPVEESPHGRFKTFRGRGEYLSQSELDGLAHRGINKVFLKRADVPMFTQYVESLFEDLDSESPMADEHKVQLLRKSAIQTMGDIFASPTPENLARGVKMVSNFVYVLMRDPKAYDLLLNLSSHDPYTLQHSVGVATNSIILAKKAGINDEKGLIEAGVGGLLHDIGKTKVPREIINKKGPLDAAEWAEMKKHSLYGYEILKDNPNIGMRAKLAVLQHHEDNNGTGYPMGLGNSQVSIFAKIVSLADIYNAITTDRSYSTAKPPFEAFKLIKEKLFHKVDAKLFEMLVHIYGGTPP